MIHECKLHCHAIDPEQADIMNLTDEGKWLPFAILLDVVVSCKMTIDDEDDKLYNCTTIFNDGGESFILDTPYHEFLKKWKAFHAQEDLGGKATSRDIEL